MTTVQEIHNEFFSAEEKLLSEAKAIIDKPRDAEVKKSERYKKLGFGTCKPVTEANMLATNQAKSKELYAGILYFRQYYPNNKFITETEVKRICDKYGLVMGDSANYTGDIPDKNLAEIENFKLREEDFTKQDNSELYGLGSLMSTQNFFEDRMRSELGMRPFSDGMPFMGSRMFASSLDNQRERMERERRERERQLYMSMANGWASAQMPASNQWSRSKPAFKICAPHADFNTLGYVVKEGFKLVYDPVVLQPVKGGFLIVSAWGDEASDELVVNHKMN